MKPKTRFISYVLWFLIGGLGAHRFYLNRKRSACILLAYTVLTTLIDIFAVDLFPDLSYFYDDSFYWITAIPLWGFLLWDAFQISRWVDEINDEINGPFVFD